jgi:hypothetical protein
MSALATKPADLRAPHPVAPVLPPEVEAAQDPALVAEYYRVRAEAIAASEADPLRYGYEPPVWKRADELLAEFRRKNPIGPLLFIVLGGIRASKTEWRCKRVIQNMLRTNNYVGWACHTTQTSSFDAQQKKIYRYIPPELKRESGRNRQGTVLKVNYTPWSGFTTDNFALPSPEKGTSLTLFKYYGIDPRALEGAEIDEGWMDEEAPIEWLDALIDRAVTRNGTVYLTFTAKTGYTPLLRAILSGATTIEEVDAELLPIRKPKIMNQESRKAGNKNSPDLSGGVESRHAGEQRQDHPVIACRQNRDSGSSAPPAQTSVPFLLSCFPDSSSSEIVGYEKVPKVQINENVQVNSGADGKKRSVLKAMIVYFHTADNPFGNYPALKERLRGASRETILTLAYGIPTKAQESKFPLFKDPVHVISLNRFREIQAGGGTWYHFLDPCSGRNWFQFWVFADPLGRFFIRAESPSHGHGEAYIPGVGDPGPWAVPGQRKDGMPGDGQKEWGWGYARYIGEMERVERLLEMRDAGCGMRDGADISETKTTERNKQNEQYGESMHRGSGYASRESGVGLDSEAVGTKASAVSEATGRHDSSVGRAQQQPRNGELVGARDENGQILSHGRRDNNPPAASRNPNPGSRIPIYERWIDARYGNARRTQEEASSTLIEDLEDAGMRFLAAPSEQTIDGGRGGGKGSLRMINDLLYYDTARPVDATNEPRLYVCESCPNTIYALKEWTGIDGQHGASKDPIDCLRMLVLSDVGYRDPGLFAPSVPWMGMRR